MTLATIANGWQQYVGTLLGSRPTAVARRAGRGEVTRVVKPRLRHPVLSESNRFHPPLSRLLSYAVALHADALADQLAREELRLTVGPVTRPALLIAGENGIVATWPARGRCALLLRERRCVEVLPYEVRLQCIGHRLNASMRYGAGRVVFVEQQAVATRAVPLHAYGQHLATAGVRLVAARAFQCLVALRRLDSAGIHVDFVRERQVRALRRDHFEVRVGNAEVADIREAGCVARATAGRRDS